MPYYHATTKVYVAGDSIVPTGPTTYYVDAVRELEMARPHGAPSRDVCVFSADSPGAASQFKEAQLRYERNAGAAYQVYEVAHVGAHRSAPMRLVAEISSRIQAATPFGPVVSEYWSPALNWHFMEWFGPELRVIAQATAGVDNEIVRSFHYGQDTDQSKRL